MASYNKLVLVGTLTRDVELRYTPKGAAVAKLGLAINRTFKSESGEKKEEVTFVDVDVFGKTAENCGQYLRKGRSVLVEGRLQTQSWEDKQTGQKKSKLAIIAETVQFLGGKSNSDSPKPEPQPRPARSDDAPLPKPDVDDTSIPF